MSKKDNYKNINDSFETGFEEVSDKELSHKFNNSYPGIPPKFNDPKFYTEMERQKISLEMTRRLKASIDNFNERSSKQTKWIIRLTIILGVLALGQILLLILK